MDNSKFDNDDFLKTFAFIGIAAISISVSPIAIYWGLRWKYAKVTKFRFTNHVILPCVGLVLLALSWVLFLDRFPLYQIDYLAKRYHLILFRVVAVWSVLLCLSHFLSPFVLLLKRKEPGIKTKDFIGKMPKTEAISVYFEDPYKVPIGHDIKTGRVVSLSQKNRCAHGLVSGATGTGKSNLMMNMILHAVRHNQPCVIIDPKGESSSLQQIREFGRKLDSNFDRRLKVFSMSEPKISCRYNPLKHGNANQLKDRLMEALVWSEQYYQNISASFLTAFTACTEYLKIPLNLNQVSKILLAKEERASILKQLQIKFDEGDRYALELHNLISPFFSKSKDDELSGLVAQISVLNNPTFGKLLSFQGSENEIDLRSIRKNGGIAYFQLDTLGNADSARRLGRMIIEDLKSLSSDVYKTESNENARVFFPIFIDEFGSFASKEFIEFLKQSRGAKFGIHLFCQGFEDMDAVSPEFRRQVISNTMTKIGLRMDDNETVEEFCATAGTFDTLKQSYQVAGDVMVNKTGLGNMRETKQMQIEHDVLKQLRIGQAVVIEKSPSRICGISIHVASDIL